MNHKITFSLHDIDKAVKEFLHKNKGHKKFAFYGAMGSGKTTFITALCNHLMATDLVSSPTFSIINEYETEPGDIIYHFDFYRIKTPNELFDIGFEEYYYDDNWCFIEWPEKAEELINNECIKVTLKVVDDNTREIDF